MAIQVLCAFQSEEIFEFVKSALQSWQGECEVIKASSESLALFLSQKNFPCLVVSELVAQSSFGLSLLSDLKAEPELSVIPLVFLSKRPADMSLPPLKAPEGSELLMWYPIESYEFIAAVKKYLQKIEDTRSPETPE